METTAEEAFLRTFGFNGSAAQVHEWFNHDGFIPEPGNLLQAIDTIAAGPDILLLNDHVYEVLQDNDDTPPYLIAETGLPVGFVGDDYKWMRFLKVIQRGDSETNELEDACPEPEEDCGVVLGLVKDSSFQKFDTSKNRVELIEPAFIFGLGEVLTFGAAKYSPNNWKRATAEDVERIKGALLRHQLAYLAGEKEDPETGISHLHHAACNLMFLDYFEREGYNE